MASRFLEQMAAEDRARRSAMTGKRAADVPTLRLPPVEKNTVPAGLVGASASEPPPRGVQAFYRRENLEIDRIHSGQFQLNQGVPGESAGLVGAIDSIAADFRRRLEADRRRPAVPERTAQATGGIRNNPEGVKRALAAQEEPETKKQPRAGVFGGGDRDGQSPSARLEEPRKTTGTGKARPQGSKSRARQPGRAKRRTGDSQGVAQQAGQAPGTGARSLRTPPWPEWGRSPRRRPPSSPARSSLSPGLWAWF